MFNAIYLYPLALAVACVAPCLALGPSKDSFEDPIILEIQALHTKSEKGDKAATDQLVSKLERLIVQNPKNLLYKVYLGSAYTLRSRDIGFGPSAYSNLKNGLKTMDEAVEADPTKITVRFIRAMNNFNLPAFVNRRDNARSDFEHLVKNIDTQKGNLAPTTQQAIYYFAGLSFVQTNRKKQGKQYLLKAAQLNSNAELNAKIAAQLKKLGSI